MAELGYLSVILAMVISVYVMVAFLVGMKRQDKRLIKSAKGGVAAVAFLVTLASFTLVWSLVTSDFSVKYVASYTTRDLAGFYKFSAWWAGNSGSMLLWAWIVALFTLIVTYSRGHDDNIMLPVVSSILTFNTFFFLAMLAFVASPFERLGYTPADGNGLNPMLQHPGMVLHPVTTYLGYVGFAIPFAYAMAAMLFNRTDDYWIKVTRRWTVIAWLFLTLGNLYGAQWAYVELGWGGLWMWDPVENASFLPWLTGSAFLHSVMIQERKNMLRLWNISLIILTYALTIFGTSLVRSGVLASVHAFVDSPLGGYFLFMTVLVIVIPFAVMISKLHILRQENEFQSFISKESSFLLNNLVLLGVTFATFWGTVYPVISEAVTGIKVTVSVPFYNQVNGPILLAMIILMGICPLIAWQKSTVGNLLKNFLYPVIFTVGVTVALYLLGMRKIVPLIGLTACAFVLITHIIEFVRGTKVRMRMTGEFVLTALGRLVVRNRRRYGGYVIHIGIIMVAVGMIFSNSYTLQVLKPMRYGESVAIGDYNLTYQNLQMRAEGNNEVVFATLSVYKGERYLGTLQPDKIFYPYWQQPRTEIAIRGTLKEDLYVVLDRWENDGMASFKINVNPGIMWVWIGMYVMIFGTAFALWPGRDRALTPKYLRRG
ncbi:MAG: heme lyase CcmF/NrfE family subunit [Dethiobacter sp.]|jgi:cytochrome c-type biogenesis protein CcmF|nr:heme lyase CcmF/NrfE family subunit [Dethiobacter sp.]